jgi:hypothetical protein
MGDLPDSLTVSIYYCKLHVLETHLIALPCSRGADLGMAMTKVDHTNASRQVQQFYALVCGNPCAFPVLKDMLREATNALSNVLLAESRCVHAGCCW